MRRADLFETIFLLWFAMKSIRMLSHVLLARTDNYYRVHSSARLLIRMNGGM